MLGLSPTHTGMELLHHSLRHFAVWIHLLGAHLQQGPPSVNLRVIAFEGLERLLPIEASDGIKLAIDNYNRMLAARDAHLRHLGPDALFHIQALDSSKDLVTIRAPAAEDELFAAPGDEASSSRADAARDEARTWHPALTVHVETLDFPVRRGTCLLGPILATQCIDAIARNHQSQVRPCLLQRALSRPRVCLRVVALDDTEVSETIEAAHDEESVSYDGPGVPCPLDLHWRLAEPHFPLLVTGVEHLESVQCAPIGTAAYSIHGVP
mmetsp:Transcript_130557/g.279089  ORF Transcript_130557/g.279089 Transcript_130557/m.279089 type:complete len:267 (+) Transcript_130557:554-1354(+)